MRDRFEKEAVVKVLREMGYVSEAGLSWKNPEHEGLRFNVSVFDIKPYTEAHGVTMRARSLRTITKREQVIALVKKAEAVNEEAMVEHREAEARRKEYKNATLIALEDAVEGTELTYELTNAWGDAVARVFYGEHTLLVHREGDALVVIVKIGDGAKVRLPILSAVKMIDDFKAAGVEVKNW